MNNKTDGCFKYNHCSKIIDTANNKDKNAHERMQFQKLYQTLCNECSFL